MIIGNKNETYDVKLDRIVYAIISQSVSWQENNNIYLYLEYFSNFLSSKLIITNK